MQAVGGRGRLSSVSLWVEGLLETSPRVELRTARGCVQFLWSLRGLAARGCGPEVVFLAGGCSGVRPKSYGDGA